MTIRVSRLLLDRCVSARPRRSRHVGVIADDCAIGQERLFLAVVLTQLQSRRQPEERNELGRTHTRRAAFDRPVQPARQPPMANLLENTVKIQISKSAPHTHSESRKGCRSAIVEFVGFLGRSADECAAGAAGEVGVQATVIRQGG